MATDKSRGVASRGHPQRHESRTLRRLEAIFWVLAAACLLPLVASWGLRTYAGTMAIEELAAAEPAVAETPGSAAARPATNFPAALRDDRSLWSSQRISAFERLKSAVVPPVVAALELPQQNARIPVFSGVDETTMTLGAGHLTDTAPLDGDGNIAITAHRDGTFRVLKDVEVGDPLILRLAGTERSFTVTRREVVAPDRVDVLDPTPKTTLTLITCHPFYYVGSAPDRFILQAELGHPAQASSHGDATARAGSGGLLRNATH